MMHIYKRKMGNSNKKKTDLNLSARIHKMLNGKRINKVTETFIKILNVAILLVDLINHLLQ